MYLTLLTLIQAAIDGQSWGLKEYGSQVVTIIAMMLTAFVLIRSRTPKILKDELNITRDKCERLDRDNHNLIKSGHLKDMEIKELKAKTDLQSVMEAQNSMNQQLIHHSQTVMDNHTQISKICGSMVETLQSISVTQERIAKKLLA